MILVERSEATSGCRVVFFHIGVWLMVPSVRRIADVLAQNRHAATSIEYTMIAAVIALAVVSGYSQIGENVNTWVLSFIAGF